MSLEPPLYTKMQHYGGSITATHPRNNFFIYGVGSLKPHTGLLFTPDKAFIEQGPCIFNGDKINKSFYGLVC